MQNGTMIQSSPLCGIGCGCVSATDEKISIGIEAKCRASPGTVQESRDIDIQDEGANWSLADHSTAAYCHVVFGSDEFKKRVTKNKEAVQILHHAYVFNFDVVVLVIGDTNRVRKGIFVEFTPYHKAMYGFVLEGIYKESLSWLYEPREGEEKYSELQIRSELEALPRNVPYRAYLDHLALWTRLNLTPPEDFIFPLPPCRRIIPTQCAFWNASKGGSDSISKLIWHNLYDPPKHFTTPQTVVISRMLLILEVCVHRLLQHMSAKEDLSAYYSLTDYRNTANKRTSSFRETLKRSKRWFVDRRKELSEQEFPINILRSEKNKNSSSKRKVRNTREAELKAKRKKKYIQKRTFATPTKNTKKLKRYKASSDILKAEIHRRDQTCTGIPFFIEREIARDKFAQYQVKCALCKKKTAWVCAGCHKAYCMGTISPSIRSEGFEDETDRVDMEFLSEVDSTTISKKVPSKIIVGRNSCYHIAHARALDRQVSRKEEESVSFHLNLKTKFCIEIGSQLDGGSVTDLTNDVETSDEESQSP
jgi:hypothetical protein